MLKKERMKQTQNKKSTTNAKRKKRTMRNGRTTTKNVNSGTSHMVLLSMISQFDIQKLTTNKQLTINYQHTRK